MRSIAKSLGHALHGLWHALSTERNLIRFSIVYLIVLAIGLAEQLPDWKWIVLILAGGFFLSVELLNTAIERFVDAFDEHRRFARDTDERHYGLKMTKDVASAASLVSLLCVSIVIVIVFYPYFSVLLL